MKTSPGVFLQKTHVTYWLPTSDKLMNDQEWTNFSHVQYLVIHNPIPKCPLWSIWTELIWPDELCYPCLTFLCITGAFSHILPRVASRLAFFNLNSSFYMQNFFFITFWAPSLFTVCALIRRHKQPLHDALTILFISPNLKCFAVVKNQSEPWCT